MKREYLLLFFLLFASSVCGLAQSDIHYSQFYETTMLRNPALTGVFSTNYKIGAFYRSQWSSITNPYQTIQLTGEYRLSLGTNSNDFVSFGVTGYNDQAGDIDQKISAAYGAINYNKSINQNKNAYLSVGFVGGYLQYSFDPAKATFNNQFMGGIYDPNNPSLESLPVPKMTLYDVGAGVNYNFSAGPSQEATYMIGVSGYHFSQPVFSYYKTFNYTQNMRLNVNAAMVREINENVMLQVHGNYTQQGTYSEAIFAGMLGWRTFEAFAETTFEIYGGVIYRYQDAFAPAVKLRYKHASFGVSYDINSSSLKDASGMRGGMEITALVTGDFPKNRGLNKKTVCPRFN